MKNKAKKISVWCVTTPVLLQEYNIHNACKHKNSIVTPNHIYACPKTDKIRKFKQKVKLPNTLKCPNCKKKFKPRIKEDQTDWGSWYMYLPAHKKTIKVVP
jgi:transcription initiation factor IIE alpha subunit